MVFLGIVLLHYVANVYSGHACIKLGNGSVVVTGGYDGNAKTRSTYRLDMEGGGRWTKLGDMTTERWGHKAAVLGGRVVVVGGEADYKRLDSVEEMDEDGTWRILPGVTMKTPRGRFSAIPVKKNLVCP